MNQSLALYAVAIETLIPRAFPSEFMLLYCIQTSRVGYLQGVGLVSLAPTPFPGKALRVVSSVVPGIYKEHAQL